MEFYQQIHTTAEEMNHTLVEPRMAGVNSKGSLHRLKHQKELLWKEKPSVEKPVVGHHCTVLQEYLLSEIRTIRGIHS